MVCTRSPTISELDALPTISQVKSPGCDPCLRTTSRLTRKWLPSKPRAAGSADSVPNAMIASNPADGEAGGGSPYRGPSRSRLFTLICRETTLMGDINSLLRFRKLPVFLLGNSARKSLISQKVGKRSFVPRLRYPVFFPVTRESHFRDRFAHDCLLQERVRCEPPWVSSCRLT